MFSCDLIGHVGDKYNSLPRDSNSLPLPPNALAGPKYLSLPLYYSGGAEGSSGAGGFNSGKCSPIPAGTALHLNPTTLAMLQQHNYIPYFRGIRARRGQG